MTPSRPQVWANLESRGCAFASWCWWSQCDLSWQWPRAQQNRPLKSKWINHSAGMLASKLPCRMSEKQREESRQPPHSPRVPVSNGRNPGTPRGWPRPDNVLKRRQQTFLRTKTNFQTQTGGESCACHKEKPPGTPPSSGWEHPLPPGGSPPPALGRDEGTCWNSQPLL